MGYFFIQFPFAKKMGPKKKKSPDGLTGKRQHWLTEKKTVTTHGNRKRQGIHYIAGKFGK